MMLFTDLNGIGTKKVLLEIKFKLSETLSCSVLHKPKPTMICGYSSGYLMSRGDGMGCQKSAKTNVIS